MRTLAYVLLRIAPIIIFILATRGCADTVARAMGDEPENTVSGSMAGNENETAETEGEIISGGETGTKTVSLNGASEFINRKPETVLIDWKRPEVSRQLKKAKKAATKIVSAISEAVIILVSDGPVEKKVDVEKPAVESENKGQDGLEPYTDNSSRPISVMETDAETALDKADEVDEWLVSGVAAQGRSGLEDEIDETWLSAGLVESVNTESAGSTEADKIAADAVSFIGIPYVSGGVSPEEGFDCSGLAYYVYRKRGYDMPRTALEQFYNGRKIGIESLKKGDLVFFQVYGSGGLVPDFVANKITEYVKTAPTHIGIYVGGGKFVHAPRPGKTVKYASLKNRFWQSHFIGARRYL